LLLPFNLLKNFKWLFDGQLTYTSVPLRGAVKHPPNNSLIDRIIIGGSQSVTGKEREIEIVYKIDIVSVLRHKIKK